LDGELGGERADAQELDVTTDDRLTEGPLENLWLRIWASWLRDELRDREATEVRVILRYDLPLLRRSVEDAPRDSAEPARRPRIDLHEDSSRDEWRALDVWRVMHQSVFS